MTRKSSAGKEHPSPAVRVKQQAQLPLSLGGSQKKASQWWIFITRVEESVQMKENVGLNC